MKNETVIDFTTHIGYGVLKTHSCEVGEWWGTDICKKVDMNDIIEEFNLPNGEYKVTITLEKINE